MPIWVNADGTIMTNADGSIIDDTQEAFEDCCCEPVIDPDKWYCVNDSVWANQTCEGDPIPGYPRDDCVNGALIIETGIEECYEVEVGSFMILYIVSGPYDSQGDCQAVCGL